MISYTVGDAAILESHDLESLHDQPVFVRTLNIGKSASDLLVRVANAGTAVAWSDSPAVTTVRRVPRTPWATRHRTEVSDSHSVPSHPVCPPRPIAVGPARPSPDP